MKKKLFIWVSVSLFLIISILVSCAPREGEEATVTVTPTEEVQYQICCWNLEHFSSTASRGFPESPGIPSRTEEQLNALASKLIDEITAEIYLFSEIEEEAYLVKLVNKMGSNWKYDVGISGSQQKTAFVWNVDKVKEIKAGDIEIPDTFFDSTKNKDRKIFDRSPQLLHIVFLDAEGNEMNDVLLIGLHLLSGARWKEPRQDGMEILLDKLPGYLSENGFDTDEKDTVFLGDFNDATFTMLYDRTDDSEQMDNLYPFMKSKGYIALSRMGYPGTRISGRQIDHIIISTEFDPECICGEAKVLRPDLSFEDYRINLTDHFPVLINVRLHSDDD